MKQLLRAMYVTVALLFTSIIGGCDPIPPLHLREEIDIDVKFPKVVLDFDVVWNYDLLYEFGYDTVYDWRKEWRYGWDETDSLLFGPIGYTLPEDFNIRRYYLGHDTLAKHTTVLRDQIHGHSFTSTYNFGYYDFLVYNEVESRDVAQSIVIDEETTLDSITAYTNETNYGTRYHSTRAYAYNQPEELFAAEKKKVYISKNIEDYDYYDEVHDTYYKYIDMLLNPVVYIYLTQVIIHHNWGKVVGTDGNANLSNFAYSTTLNTGIAGNDPVAVHYNTRLKQNVYDTLCNEEVDIVGGRLTTFGIRGINPFDYRYHLQIPEQIRNQRHYMDVNLIFGNGNDSTLYFDVTDQVIRRFRGGVITVELDMDTIRSPGRNGGSGFDAVVQVWVDETHEFDVKD